MILGSRESEVNWGFSLRFHFGGYLFIYTESDGSRNDLIVEIHGF